MPAVLGRVSSLTPGRQAAAGSPASPAPAVGGSSPVLLHIVTLSPSLPHAPHWLVQVRPLLVHPWALPLSPVRVSLCPNQLVCKTVPLLCAHSPEELVPSVLCL